MSDRPYELLARQVSAQGERAERMQAVVDLLWRGLKDTGVSWVGFYLAAGPDELVLGPSRDKPACSPIGMHGVCGQAFTQGRPRVVADVRTLGPNYVACDPRDQSEVVIPLSDTGGTCWGVLDLDSLDVGAFDEQDVNGLQQVLLAAGLTS